MRVRLVCMYIRVSGGWTQKALCQRNDKRKLYSNASQGATSCVSIWSDGLTFQSVSSLCVFFNEGPQSVFTNLRKPRNFVFERTLCRKVSRLSDASTFTGAHWSIITTKLRALLGTWEKRGSESIALTSSTWGVLFKPYSQPRWRTKLKSSGQRSVIWKHEIRALVESSQFSLEQDVKSNCSVTSILGLTFKNWIRKENRSYEYHLP